MQLYKNLLSKINKFSLSNCEQEEIQFNVYFECSFDVELFTVIM